MAKKRRPAEEEAPTELNGVHASRQKRIKYTEEDAKLASIYNDLADEVQAVRIKAAGDLFKQLASKSPDQEQRLENAETRLIRGLCSGRKAARLGFSVALAEVLRLKFSGSIGTPTDGVGLQNTLDRIVTLTTVHGNVSGQERRDYGLGRRFAFQALLQSDVAFTERMTDQEWQSLTKAVFELASQKQWLRRECGAMLYEYLTSPSGSKLSDTRVRLLVDVLINFKLAKSPEGVGLWITVQTHFPHVKLPKDVWHHRDPLSSKERDALLRVMVETTTDDDAPAQKSGSRQATPSFAWDVLLSKLFQGGGVKDFGRFWDSAAKSMFSPSASLERKALGLQIVSQAIGSAPKTMLPEVLRPPTVVQCVLDHRSNQEKILFDAAKGPLQRMVSRSKQNPGVAGIFMEAFVKNGAPNLDQLTKTKTMEGLINEANTQALGDAVVAIKGRISDPRVADVSDVQNQRRALGDLLLNIVRSCDRAGSLFTKTPNGGEDLSDPIKDIILMLAEFGFAESEPKPRPAITDQTRVMIRSRLMSCLGIFVDQPVQRAVNACKDVVRCFQSSNAGFEAWSQRSQAALDAVTAAWVTMLQMKEKDTGFQLLLCLGIVQVFNNEPDSIEVLQDLMECYESRGQNDSPTLLVELLLSFVSKPSALFRKLAEQVFTSFAPQLTADGLQSLIDILGRKESLSGQRELFDDDTEMAEEAGDEEDEEDEAIDVEEESDVELVNGYEVEKSGSESDASSADPSDAEEGASEIDDEEAAFDKKLADALGTAGMDDDSDDDGSDMDDEQMMALEPHLASIFQERQKSTTRKQDKKDAKENIVNFKNRVLDLLAIYVKSQYANVLALDLILPLVNMIRTTTSKPTAEKAFAVLKQYFEACNKNKKFPAPEEIEACFEVLIAVLDEMKLEGSKLHGNACSRSGLFLSKVLVALDQELYARIAGLYADLQAEWYLDPASKVPSSVFTEWTSWSITTRKHG